MDVVATRLRGKASWLINKISTQAHRMLADTLAPVDGRGYHFAILATLEEFGPASQIELGQRCGIDRSDTHAMVNELVEGGFAKRTADPADRRRNIITITGAGRKRLDQLDRMLEGLQDRLLSALSAQQRHQLVELLSRVIDSQPVS